MSIEMSGSDYVNAYIKNSSTCVKNAITALNSAKATFMLAGDTTSTYKCSTFVNKLITQKTKLNNVASDFEATKATLDYVDRHNTTTYDSSTGEFKNAGAGVALGILSSVFGHAAASNSLNALKTALYRKGASQLHGFAFEVMFADKLNNGLAHKLFTKAIVDGSNKTGSDVIVKRFGKIIETYELKATGTKAYAMKALSKANSIYKGSILIFTDEMAKEVGGRSGGYTLSATKSTATAAKTYSKATLALKSIGKSAVSSGVAGAVVDGGLEAVTKFSAWKSGKITGKQYLGGVAKGAAIGGTAGAITGVVLATVAAAGVTLTGGTALIAGAVIGGVANWGLHKFFGK